MLIRLFKPNLSNQKGDTIIEVMFAVAVFGLIAVTSLALMNQGIATSQRAVEITTVRQQIDAQAEALRFLQTAYVQEYETGTTYDLVDANSTPAEEYYRITRMPSASASKFGSRPCNSPPTNSFVINTRTARVLTDSALFTSTANRTSAQVIYNASNVATASNGIWIEAVRSTATNNVGYIDFHIRGCWDAPGLSVPMNLGTIVRLYEPRG